METTNKNPLIDSIISKDEELRNQSFHQICETLTLPELMTQLGELEQFRSSANNLYHSVRASLMLYTAYRFIFSTSKDIPSTGHISYDTYSRLLERQFEGTIQRLSAQIKIEGINANLASAMATAYHQLTFQLLANQVKKSVRASKGNRWMFRLGHRNELPIQVHADLLNRVRNTALYPVLREETSVRLDLTHSAWSDIFFLGMDFPEGANVVNVSVNLGVYGRDKEIHPPISSYFRVIDEPVIRLTSLDLKTTKDIASLDDLFNFGSDYLSLLKAGIIASGFIPPAFESTHQDLAKILSRIVGPGMGIELVTKVNDIPKGSRLAVSTNLLGSIISVIMRATGQTNNLTGPLHEAERRLVASRAILGEWLGGSGGGWQDSGGVWPGIKIIQGTTATDGDPEFGISKGCLLPRHTILDNDQIHPDMDERLTKSLVLMHGGMAQNVGPILEMVTEKYLLRSEKEWEARKITNEIYGDILEALKTGDIKKLATATQRNWDGPIKTIIPWASNHFTETIIKKAKVKLGKDFWGFLMLGGMSGGGMGMFVNPVNYANCRQQILAILKETKMELSTALPFAMEPVIYNFKINHRGTYAQLFDDHQALMPTAYYQLMMPTLVHRAESLPDIRKVEYNLFTKIAQQQQTSPELMSAMVSHLYKISQPDLGSNQSQEDQKAKEIKEVNGFDFIQHEQIRTDLKKGHIGMFRNRLSVDTHIEDVKKGDFMTLKEDKSKTALGIQAIKDGTVGVLTLAGGVGSRWTKGAGVIKALNPFVQYDTNHHSFLEIHLKKSHHTTKTYEAKFPHIIATSHLTHQAIEKALRQNKQYGFSGKVFLSPGRSIGQRFIPMEKDLRFLWQETQQEILDENKQKVLESVREALIGWAQQKGEGADYVDNLAAQRFSPLGHWYEVSNMLRNGTLAKVITDFPKLNTILLHNVDTLGANLDPAALGHHLDTGKMLTFEVIPRRIDDTGGGLARINNQVRILEGLAQPRQSDELKLSYYNSMSTWIDIDGLLEWFGLNRADLKDDLKKVDQAVREKAKQIPTYVTIKDVKYRWGHGQEDIYPVAQVEKLWSDMTAVPEVDCGFMVVPRLRGQQLKSPDQLDAWLNDGSWAFVGTLIGAKK